MFKQFEKVRAIIILAIISKVRVQKHTCLLNTSLNTHVHCLKVRAVKRALVQS